MTEGDLISLDSDSQNYGRKNFLFFHIFPDFSHLASRIFYNMGNDDTEYTERIHQKILKEYIKKYWNSTEENTEKYLK